jgi:DNA-binding beta-propeller fold protein YncE
MSDVVVGTEGFRYRFVQQWAALPEGFNLGDASGVAVDSRDRVYVFARGEHPIVVFDRDGNVLNTWGHGTFSKRPHALHMGPDDTLYCTDAGDHTVRRYTLDGKLLMQLGIPGTPSPPMSGLPFCKCTHTALSPEGYLYVSDGYDNARVHKYSPDGKLLFSWGASGTAAGEFNVPHNVCCDADGLVYVADMENHRVQIFDGKGSYQGQWQNTHRPCGLHMTGGTAPLAYVGELPPWYAHTRGHPNVGAAVKIVDPKTGTVLARLGASLPGCEPGHFIAPHGIAVDSRGDIYVGELPNATWTAVFAEERPKPSAPRTLVKLVKLDEAGP